MGEEIKSLTLLVHLKVLFNGMLGKEQLTP